MLIRILLTLLVSVSSVQAATYYISPTGSNSNIGNQATQGSGTNGPFLSFSYAINASRAWCGDTLILVDGTYGDGTSTGKISLSTVACTVGDDLTITAQNQRQAKIIDNGTGIALNIVGSSHIIINGLYLRSTDNSASTGGSGRPAQSTDSNHLTLKNNIFANPNRYGNTGAFTMIRVTDVLMEDNETYIFHRHCVTAIPGERIVVRRQYCNPRGGRIAGGYNASAGLGGADALFSMYPCKDCLLENSIADGTTNPMYLSEMNATYSNSILMSGTKVLGSICYKCNYGNGIFPQGRNVADLNHSPQNITIDNVAIVDSGSSLNGIRCADCVNVTIDHVSIFGGATRYVQGIVFDDSSVGVAAAAASITIKNSLVADTTTGFRALTTYGSWSINETISTSNTTNYNPSSHANLTNTSTAAHGMGTCKVWVPATATGKGAGTNGEDIGATILYRYTDGVLTTVPLWSPVTGEFPYGVADPDGVNRVVGESLFDIHTRLNVNANGCSFPPGYGSTAPTNPSNVVKTTDTEGAHIHVIPVGTKALTVAVAVRWDDFLNTTTTDISNTITSSCGGDVIPSIDATWSTPAGDRKMRIFGLLDPTPGTCTLTPNLATANWSGWVMTSVDDMFTDSYGSVASSSGLSASPSGTVVTASDEDILIFLATSNAPTISAGAGQISLSDKVHATKALRGALSSRSGADGGVGTWVLSGSYGWIQQMVSRIPAGGGGGSAATFTLSKYAIDGLLGSTSTPQVSLTPGTTDTQGRVAVVSAGRIRAEILVGVATSSPTGIALYCRKNAGAYFAVGNTFGSNDIRLYGPGAETTIPVTNTPTTQRFSGTFTAGKTVRDATQPVTLGAIASGTRTEVDYQFVIGNAAIAGDVFDCQVRKDSGETLNTYSVTPSILVVGASASLGF